MYTNLALYSRDLSEAINNSTYRKFRQFHLLKFCLIFLVLSGDEGNIIKSGSFLRVAELIVRIFRINHEKEESQSFKYRHLVLGITCENPQTCDVPFLLRTVSSSHSSSHSIVDSQQSCHSSKGRTVVDVASDSDDDKPILKAKSVHQSHHHSTLIFFNKDIVCLNLILGSPPPLLLPCQLAVHPLCLLTVTLTIATKSGPIYGAYTE